jgi:hypothetical protein
VIAYSIAWSVGRTYLPALQYFITPIFKENFKTAELSISVLAEITG